MKTTLIQYRRGPQRQPDGIACWIVNTDNKMESLLRHAYFFGANDPYSTLKTTLKAEINPKAWATLSSDTSRPFGGMKVFKVYGGNK